METATNKYADSKLIESPCAPLLIVFTGGVSAECGHFSGTLPHCTIETIHARAEAVTPLLREILDHCPPEPWAIDD